MLAPTTLAGLAGARGVGDDAAPGSTSVRAAIAALAGAGRRPAGRWWPAAAGDRPGVRGQGSRDGGHGQPARRPGDAGIDAAPRARRRPGTRPRGPGARRDGRPGPTVAATALLLGGLDADAEARPGPHDRSGSRRHVQAARRDPRARVPGRRPADRERLRLHLGHGPGGRAGRARSPRGDRSPGRDRRSRSCASTPPIAAAPGDRFALRRPSPGSVAGGGVVLDAQPPRGVSRRRMTRGTGGRPGRRARRRGLGEARPPRRPARRRRVAARAGRRGGAPRAAPSSSSRPTTPRNPSRPACRCRRCALTWLSRRAAS